jgi:hypothetical protein
VPKLDFVVSQEAPEIVADIADDFDRPHKGKGKKGKKGKCGGGAANMPRKAIKNLIQQELEKTVPGIFDELME